MATNRTERDFDDDDQAGPGPSEWAKLLLRAAWRRKLLFVAVLVAASAGVFAYYRTKTPLYRVEAKIFVQRQQMVPSSVRSQGDDSPINTAWELVHRRENLTALAKAANLMATPDLPGVSFAEKIKSGDTREDPAERIIKILNRQLLVTTDDGGTITVSFDWPDPQKAYRVVDGTVTNFIEARHVQEVTAIEDVMSVLRARAAKAREELGRVTDEVRREGTVVAASAAREPTGDKPRPTPAAAKPPSDELVRLKSLLDGKQRAIEDVEEFRRRRLAELHAQLDERRNTYSDAHPMVVQLKQDIDSLSKESSQVAGLRADEAQLRKQYEALLAKEGVTDAAATQQLQSTRVLSTPSAPRSRAAGTPVEDDERVRGARFEYQQIEERVNAAQLELDAVRAAFKYRYNIVWPPQVPLDPVSPNPVKIFGAGLLAALMLAFGAAAAPDLRAGRIVERWQVERTLDLPILGEVREK
jgi:uncharacterized protein involved in exopolysaccharide biosynthesis